MLCIQLAEYLLDHQWVFDARFDDFLCCGRLEYGLLRVVYLIYVSHVYKEDFPNLLSYTRFLEVMLRVIVPMCAYFTSLKGKPTGVDFIDSTSIKVYHNIRIPRHKTFDGIAQRVKGTMGWFYGFKLQLIVNYQGEIVAVKVTTGNVHDAQPEPTIAFTQPWRCS
jgi:hypothetical protein